MAGRSVLLACLSAYLYGGHRRLLGGECDKGAALALALLVPKHCALVNGSVSGEQLSDILFVVLLAQHAHKEFSLWKKDGDEEKRKEGMRIRFITLANSLPVGISGQEMIQVLIRNSNEGEDKGRELPS